MACIKTTRLSDPESQLMMETLGFINRPGLSQHSIWGDPHSGEMEFYLKPDTVIHSARQVVQLAYRVGFAQGEKNAKDELSVKLKNLSSELIDVLLS
jgi:hypothetical protein